MMTHDEIGRIFGLTATRVRQIEQRAIQKLKRGLEQRGVKLADVQGLPPAPNKEFSLAAPSARQHRFHERAT
jgi:hypothetical protein